MNRKRMAMLLPVLWLAAAGAMGFAARPAEAVQPVNLPPDAQRVLILELRGLSPYVRQLSVNAIRIIPPDRAWKMVGYLEVLRSYPDAQVVQFSRQLDFVLTGGILQILPQNYHQRFINGLWGVTDADEQFAQMAIQWALQIIQPLGGGGAPGASGVVPPIDMWQTTIRHMQQMQQTTLWDMQQSTTRQGYMLLCGLGASYACQSH